MSLEPTFLNGTEIPLCQKLSKTYIDTHAHNTTVPVSAQTYKIHMQIACYYYLMHIHLLTSTRACLNISVYCYMSENAHIQLINHRTQAIPQAYTNTHAHKGTYTHTHTQAHNTNSTSRNPLSIPSSTNSAYTTEKG